MRQRTEPFKLGHYHIVEIWTYKGIHPTKLHFSRNDISTETVETIKTLVMQAVKP